MKRQRHITLATIFFMAYDFQPLFVGFHYKKKSLMIGLNSQSLKKTKISIYTTYWKYEQRILQLFFPNFQYLIFYKIISLETIQYIEPN